MYAEIGMGLAALISSGGGIYAVVVSRTTREASTRKIANEAADVISQAAGNFTKQIQEESEKTAERNRELAKALNALIDVLDEILQDLSEDGAILGSGCPERRADKEMTKRLQKAIREAKLV